MEVRAAAVDKRDNRYYVPTTRTDENGNYELRFISPGEQHIQVEPFWLQADQAPKGSTQVVTDQVRRGFGRHRFQDGLIRSRIPSQANNSSITLPLLAIFIGRPFLLVKVVSSEMPSALQTVAITSCEV